MASYLVHASRERARFRHQVFANAENMRRAIKLLQESGQLAGIKPGEGSILVFFEPGVDLAALCHRLEEEFPQLREVPAAPSPKKPKTVSIVRNANTRRKLELKGLLGAGLTTVLLAAIGWHHWHAWAGGAFALLATRHVWERRERL